MEQSLLNTEGLKHPLTKKGLHAEHQEMHSVRVPETLAPTRRAPLFLSAHLPSLVATPALVLVPKSNLALRPRRPFLTTSCVCPVLLTQRRTKLFFEDVAEVPEGTLCYSSQGKIFKYFMCPP